LRILRLGLNGIGDQGAQDLAPILQKEVLETLGLSYNNIRLGGAKCIGEALKTNHSLCELYLQHNKIGDAGMTYLCEGLVSNTTMRTVAVGSNDVTTQSANTISEVLKNNTTLMHLVRCLPMLSPSSAPPPFTI
jgi:Ran GTPase-activating protein (RanGAP) involved in mRNA processing and transport